MCDLWKQVDELERRVEAHFKAHEMVTAAEREPDPEWIPVGNVPPGIVVVFHPDEVTGFAGHNSLAGEHVTGPSKDRGCVLVTNVVDGCKVSVAHYRLCRIVRPDGVQELRTDHLTVYAKERTVVWVCEGPGWWWWGLGFGGKCGTTDTRDAAEATARKKLLEVCGE